MTLPTLAGIRDAATLLAPPFANTPFFRSVQLSRYFDADVWLKVESANPIASFKSRGATTAIFRATRGGQAAEIVTSSTGNHGASTAAYAARAGLPCVIFTLASVPDTMKTLMQAYGAAVVACVSSEQRWTLMREGIERFARDLLSTIAGDVSVTLNRLAITHAGAEKRGLGAIVLENGPLTIRQRLKPVLEAGRDARLLHFDSAEEAYRVFFGLVVRDTQIRLLLGEELTLSPVQIDKDAKAATEQFLALYGAGEKLRP